MVAINSASRMRESSVFPVCRKQADLGKAPGRGGYDADRVK